MLVTFDPIIHLGPLVFAWHSVFTGVAIFVGALLGVRLLYRRIRSADVYALAIWGVIGGVVGGRIFHVADCWSSCGYAANPVQIVELWSGDLSIWGAAIGGTLAGVAVAIHRRLPMGICADAAAAGMALGFAVGRIGDIALRPLEPQAREQSRSRDNVGG